MEETLENQCPFCRPTESRVIIRLSQFYLYRDKFPISPGHTLVIPYKHVATIDSLEEEEQKTLFKSVLAAQEELNQSHQPDGYNIGINQGLTGGQTVPHLHIHVIPRYHGDKPDPRGGVRWIFPDKADYWS